MEQAAAVIIEAGYEVKLFGDIRRPSMVGCIMLNKLSCVVRDDLVVMDGPLRPGEIKAVFFALSIMVGSDTFSR